MYGKQLSSISHAPAISPLELRRVRQPRSPTPQQRSNSQTLPPAPAASGDYPPTTHRTHALAETVRLGTLTTIGLISALHRTPLSYLAKRPLLKLGEYIRTASRHPIRIPAATVHAAGLPILGFERKYLQKSYFQVIFKFVCSSVHGDTEMFWLFSAMVCLTLSTGCG